LIGALLLMGGVGASPALLQFFGVGAQASAWWMAVGVLPFALIANHVILRADRAWPTPPSGPEAQLPDSQPNVAADHPAEEPDAGDSESHAS
jgi:hypothetical protein